jgi:hypothetical protein
MKRSLVLLALLIAAGCTSVSVNKIDKNTVYPPTNSADITVFPEKPVDQAFIEVGEITVTGAGDWEQVEKVFRNKAAQMGADAVYVSNKQKEASASVYPDDRRVASGEYYPYAHFGWKKYRGTPITPGVIFIAAATTARTKRQANS